MKSSSTVHGIARAIAAALLGSVMLTALPALAQDQPAGGPPAARRGNVMGKMLLHLNPPLTNEQKSRIRQMRADMMKQNQGVSDRSVRRAHAKAFYAQINGVLTPAQAADFKNKMATMRAKYRAEHPDAH